MNHSEILKAQREAQNARIEAEHMAHIKAAVIAANGEAGWQRYLQRTGRTE